MILAALIVTNKSEYVEWQQRLIISEKRKSFYLRILESWKANSQQIIQLAQNARTEIFSLKTQDKANEDITKEKLIRHVKDEDYSDNNYITILCFHMHFRHNYFLIFLYSAK